MYEAVCAISGPFGKLLLQNKLGEDRIRISVTALLVTSAFCWSAPSFAQASAGSADQGQDATGERGLAGIIVTANRVQIPAQNTPIALNVYGGADLKEQGVASVRDLSLIDPSLNVSDTTGSADVATYGVRGSVSF